MNTFNNNNKDNFLQLKRLSLFIGNISIENRLTKVIGMHFYLNNKDEVLSILNSMNRQYIIKENKDTFQLIF